MNVNISVENVLGYADSYLWQMEMVYKIRVKHGYKKGDCVDLSYCRHEDLKYEYEILDHAERELNAICDITGLDWGAMVQMSRIMSRYYASDTYGKLGVCLHEQDFERLYQVLSAEEPEWDGVYLNPYTEKGIRRFDLKRYEENVSVWGTW